jgi:hypothetical protein
VRFSRRELLWAMGGVVPVEAAHLTGVSPRRQEVPPPRELVDLAPGTPLGPCRLMRVMPAERGGIPVVMADPEGRAFEVELHRHDERAPGLARAGSLDVYLRNGGDGAKPSDETHGLGAIALARLLADRELAGKRVPRLASIVERWSRFGASA